MQLCHYLVGYILTYTGIDWFPNWGQSTTVSDYILNQDTLKKYENLNYQGVQFGAPVDASQMTTLHFDLWTPNCTAFDVYLINTSPTTVEQKVTVNPTLNGWNSFDIPLSSYDMIALNNIGQFKLVGDPFGNSTVYLDNIYFYNSSVLPVSLAEFRASKSGSTTVLNWKTLAEFDNKGFAVERSKDGLTWAQISFVNAKGNGTAASIYTTVDRSPMDGNNQYRLKQVNNDGKITYSYVVSLTGVRTELEVSTSILIQPKITSMCRLMR